MKLFLKKLIKAVTNPKLVLLVAMNNEKIAHLFSDKLYLKIKYRLAMRKKLNIKNPQAFNEKLQWLKLHDRNPEYTKMVDKYEVRKYIAETIGEDYLIPLLGVWDSPEEIDFDSLPNQFVLKCTHNSGLGMCICKDKSQLDIEKVKQELAKGLKQNYFITSREWPYKNVKPRIIAEQYMVDESGIELKDYKIMCFDGEFKCSFVCSDRYEKGGLRVTFFDRKWNKLPFERHYPSSKKEIKRPNCYEKMIELAELLSKNMKFVRIDFYEIEGKIYFGEITFFPGSGMEEFTPEEWDYNLGKYITI